MTIGGRCRRLRSATTAAPTARRAYSARGGGDVAQNIVAAAARHGIPIERDPDLLQCLGPLAVGTEVPIAAYEAVARILAFLYAQNRPRPH